jgi:hypothetical protein
MDKESYNGVIHESQRFQGTNLKGKLIMVEGRSLGPFISSLSY